MQVNSEFNPHCCSRLGFVTACCAWLATACCTCCCCSPSSGKFIVLSMPLSSSALAAASLMGSSSGCCRKETCARCEKQDSTRQDRLAANCHLERTTAVASGLRSVVRPDGMIIQSLMTYAPASNCLQTVVPACKQQVGHATQHNICNSALPNLKVVGCTTVMLLS